MSAQFPGLRRKATACPHVQSRHLVDRVQGELIVRFMDSAVHAFDLAAAPENSPRTVF